MGNAMEGPQRSERGALRYNRYDTNIAALER